MTDPWWVVIAFFGGFLVGIEYQYRKMKKEGWHK